MAALELLAQVCNETSEGTQHETRRLDISELEAVRGAILARGLAGQLHGEVVKRRAAHISHC